MKQLTWSNALRSTGKEIIVGFINGFLFAIIAGFLSYIIFGELNLSLIDFNIIIIKFSFWFFFWYRSSYIFNKSRRRSSPSFGDFRNNVD